MNIFHNYICSGDNHMVFKLHKVFTMDIVCQTIPGQAFRFNKGMSSLCYATPTNESCGECLIRNML